MINATVSTIIEMQFIYQVIHPFKIHPFNCMVFRKFSELCTFIALLWHMSIPSQRNSVTLATKPYCRISDHTVNSEIMFIGKTCF